MPKQSAGILLYRRGPRLEVFLVHPGGPFWAGKDDGAWSIPKGEFDEGEEPLAAARREFAEETGFAVSGHFTALQPVKQKGGKIVYAFAIEGDCDAQAIRSNTFEMEWPRGSGKSVAFPEADRAQWFESQLAKRKLNPAQANLIDQLQALLPNL
ncbi:MAG: NUDIX domain-containing protein [Burkholderiales bacterium]